MSPGPGAAPSMPRTLIIALDAVHDVFTGSLLNAMDTCSNPGKHRSKSSRAFKYLSSARPPPRSPLRGQGVEYREDGDNPGGNDPPAISNADLLYLSPDQSPVGFRVGDGGPWKERECLVEEFTHSIVILERMHLIGKPWQRHPAIPVSHAG